MTKLKLEAGKYYLTRDGRKVGPLDYIGHGGNCEFGYWSQNPNYVSDVNRWAADGSYFRGVESDEDLIAEWTDTPALKVGDKVRVIAGYGGTLNGRIGEVTQFDGRNMFVASHQGLPYALWDEGGAKFHLYFFGSEVEPIPTIGTLAEINAQVGDVVEWVFNSEYVYYAGEHQGKTHTVDKDGRVMLNGGDGSYWGYVNDPDDGVIWRIISRASDDIVLTDEEMAIIEAAMADDRPKVSLDDANERIAEVMQRGPVITETVKRIVPGVYGKVRVGNDGPNGGILVDLRCGITTRAELIAARDVFSALIDAMPDAQ